MINPQIYNDEWTLDDQIGQAPHVADVGKIITSCTPPYVLGIHGDWGAGKTSFLRKLHLYLSGNSSGYDGAKAWCETHWGEDHARQANIEAIWFDAWHHQFEANPVTALLNEIRSHFTLSKRFVGNTAKYTYAALMSIDDLTKKIGISPEKIVKAGEKYERDQLSQPLPSQLCKDLLEQAITTLIGKKGNKRLVIFVDDLDRCMGQVAFRFLEALKVYFSISNCVFVLGIDVRHVRRAVAAELQNAGVIPETTDGSSAHKSELYAADYLSKMFQNVYYLPGMNSYDEYLSLLMDDNVLKEKELWMKTILDFKLLPSNPRKIKSFISGLTFYVNQLNPFLKDAEPDRNLALIFAYLKFMANDIYRILENDQDFWAPLVTFCRSGNANDHWALRKLTLPEIASAPASETDYQYESSFPDPADESLFRAAKLIREWNEGASPTEDEFKIYLLRGK